jgi:uncharacterized Zn-binding protein involved in type VI secretion
MSVNEMGTDGAHFYIRRNMMSTAISRLGDSSNHGGTIITASSDMFVDGIAVARLGDLHSCPIPYHGITPIIAASSTNFNDTKGIARIGDKVGCGATIIQGSSKSFSG